MPHRRDPFVRQPFVAAASSLLARDEMPFIAVYDACVFYPASLRDLLIRLATKKLFQAKWSDQILDELQQYRGEHADDPLTREWERRTSRPRVDLCR